MVSPNDMEGYRHQVVRGDGCPRVAIVGSGIAGLTAAIGLQDACETVLYDAAPQLGGHILPHAVHDPTGAPTAVDTGFVVFVPQMYPQVTAMMEALHIAHAPAITPFRITDTQRDLSFEAAELVRLCGKRLPKECRRDLLTLYRVLAQVRRDGPEFVPNVPLAQWVKEQGYQQATIELGVLPWVASFWGMRPDTVLTVSTRVALREIARNTGPHGMHRVVPSTRHYLDTLLDTIDPTEVRMERVQRIELASRPRLAADTEEVFDRVVLAVDAIEARALLRGAVPALDAALASFDYAPTVAIVHHDESLLPRDKADWRTFHHRREPDGERIGGSTTWVLDLLHEWHDDPTEIDRPTLLTTGARSILQNQRIAEDKLVHAYRHRHLVATPEVVDALPTLATADENQSFSLAGSYLGLGALHEDALVSGMRAASKVRNELSLPAPRWPWRQAG